MSRPKRPTAFEVSFGVEDANERDTNDRSGTVHLPVASVNGKRKDRGTDGSAARQNSQKRARKEAPAGRRPALVSHKDTLVPLYTPTPHDIKDSSGILVLGEDPDERYRDGDKPIRYLDEFAAFFPNGPHAYRLASLSILDAEDCEHKVECAGFVAPVPVNEEDAGQEDGLDDDDRRQRLRTSNVARYTVDYTKIDGHLRIETEHAWYILRAPANMYRPQFLQFYRQHRIAQLVLAEAFAGILKTFSEFEALYVGHHDNIIGDLIQLSDLQEGVPIVRALIANDGTFRSISSHPIVHHILTAPAARTFFSQPSPAAPSHHRPAQHHLRPCVLDGIIGNADLAVLRPENLNPTTVTPLIDHLALGLFHERLQVIGPPPRKESEHERWQRQRLVRTRLLSLLYAALRARTSIGDTINISFPSAFRLRDEYWSAVRINNELYKVGECIIVEAGAYRKRTARDIPLIPEQSPMDAHLADYVWFAKIVNINQQRKTIHVQWYEHSSKTFLEEISNPQELFLCPICSDIRLADTSVLGKAVVHDSLPISAQIPPNEFFSRFMYNEAEGTFTDNLHPSEVQSEPPENCCSCLFAAQHNQAQVCDARPDQVNYLGVTYHINDYALVFSDQGPGDIGRITEIKRRRRASPIVCLALLGRMTDITAFPEDGFLDEHELFVTNMHKEVDAKDLVQRCVVIHHTAVDDLESWTALSPYHFFVKYHLPSLKPRWDARKELAPSQFPVCPSCYRRNEEKCKAITRLPRLRAFDPFAGVGAFSLSMEEAGCVQLTHAVEISPSAADTLKKNCPSVKVFNQCSNVVLQHAVKTHAGQRIGPLRDLDNKNDLPLPPQPGQIDCIIAGFPCQPHSTLNMYQLADDRKSHLMLNLLSWIDFLRPNYCFLENVSGFLNYRLRASQAGRHRVEGGITMGGLKFFVNAMLTMGYQTRVALLQAGHYGTPQRRTRFFLIASLRGYPLPDFPQPSHNSIIATHLEVTFPNGVSIRPILTAEGTAPLKYVSVGDAIDDLTPFDWENPKKLLPTGYQLPRYRTVSCKGPATHCGPSGDPYAHEPKNSFQRKCRERPTGTSIQHFTRVLKPDIVERVVNVKLEPNADYTEFPTELREWLNLHPTSATARKGFFPGFYGRLDRNGWFHTTVTNVEPTAKQSYVVHPWCQRVVSVRELARSQGFPDWFVFVARGNLVRTMQRQIGNAVPWPVGRALGRELREAMLKKARMQNRVEVIDLLED